MYLAETMWKLLWSDFRIMFSVRKRDACYLPEKKREMYVIVYFNATTVPLSTYLSFTICRSFLWQSQAWAKETSEEMTCKDVKKKLVNLQMSWFTSLKPPERMFIWDISYCLRDEQGMWKVHIRFWFWGPICIACWRLWGSFMSGKLCSCALGLCRLWFKCMSDGEFDCRQLIFCSSTLYFSMLEVRGDYAACVYRCELYMRLLVGVWMDRRRE